MYKYEINISWNQDDVEQVRKDNFPTVKLTDKEIEEILNKVLEEHDAEKGIRDSIKDAMDFIINNRTTYLLVKPLYEDHIEHYTIVEKSEVQEVINFRDNSDTYIFETRETSFKEEELIAVNKKYKELKEEKELWLSDNIAEWLSEFFNTKVKHAYGVFDIEEAGKPALYLSDNQFEEDDLLQYDTEWYYSAWDGHNHVDNFIEEPDGELEFQFEQLDWINMDEWDGHNWNFAQQAHTHVRLAKWSEDNYAWAEYSDWQGSCETIEFLSTQQLINRLEAVEVDLPEELKFFSSENQEVLKESINQLED
jgi:hypothetical protein